MNATLEGRTVAKDKEKKDKSYLSVKLDAETYRMVRLVAAWHGVTIADYLSDIVRPVAKKDFEKIGVKKPPEDAD